MFKHSAVGLMRHCRVCFGVGQAADKKQTEKKEGDYERALKWLKARRNVLRNTK